MENLERRRQPRTRQAIKTPLAEGLRRTHHVTSLSRVTRLDFRVGLYSRREVGSGALSASRTSGGVNETNIECLAILVRSGTSLKRKSARAARGRSDEDAPWNTCIPRGAKFARMATPRASVAVVVSAIQKRRTLASRSTTTSEPSSVLDDQRTCDRDPGLERHLSARRSWRPLTSTVPVTTVGWVVFSVVPSVPKLLFTPGGPVGIAITIRSATSNPSDGTVGADRSRTATLHLNGGRRDGHARGSNVVQHHSVPEYERVTTCAQHGVAMDGLGRQEGASRLSESSRTICGQGKQQGNACDAEHYE